jgi:hypothetical protein
LLERDPASHHAMMPNRTDTENYAEVQDLVDRCGKVLHGHDPMLQGAALADLLAMWLAGHVGPGAEQLRHTLLFEHIRTVRSLVPVNEAMIMERLKPAGEA